MEKSIISWHIPIELKKIFFKFFYRDIFLDLEGSGHLTLLQNLENNIFDLMDHQPQDIYYMNFILGMIKKEKIIYKDIDSFIHNLSNSDPYRIVMFSDIINYRVVKDAVSFLIYTWGKNEKLAEFLANPSNFMNENYFAESIYHEKLIKSQKLFITILEQQHSIEKLKENEYELNLKINKNKLYGTSLLRNLEEEYNPLIQSLFDQNIIHPNDLILKEIHHFQNYTFFESLMEFPNDNRFKWLEFLLEKYHTEIDIDSMILKSEQIINSDLLSIRLFNLSDQIDNFNHILKHMKKIQIQGYLQKTLPINHGNNEISISKI